MSIGLKVSGAWKDVSAVSVRVGGAWKTVSQAYIRVGGTWKELLGSRGPSSLIDRTSGSVISNFNSLPGNAFDGVTSQGNGFCAGKSATAANSGYVGKTMAGPTAIENATVRGSSNLGYVDGSNPSVTLELYGKQGSAPSSATNGTLLGTITFTDTNNESSARQIDSTDVNTYWDHLWIRLSQSTNSAIRIAEIEMTGWV